MRICDGHCDTIKKLAQGLPIDFSFTDAAENDGFLQLFAYFSKEDETCPDEAFVTIKAFSSENRAQIVYTPRHALSVLHSGRLGAFLSLENCCCLGENTDSLYPFFNLGIRAVSLTWNSDNQFAHGADCPRGGLKEKGRDLILLAEKLGILIDVSHLNRTSFFDVISFGHGKLFASHSSAYSVNPHPRNLTDEQITALYNSGGIICACPYPPFVNGTENATADEFIRHIRHISRLTDGLGVGLGSDTDGVKFSIPGLKTTSDLIAFQDLLRERNFTNYEIQNIFSCNFERFLEKSAKK